MSRYKFTWRELGDYALCFQRLLSASDSYNLVADPFEPLSQQVKQVWFDFNDQKRAWHLASPDAVLLSACPDRDIPNIFWPATA